MLVKIKRDKQPAWAKANPVLAEGELGYATDTRTLKIGDGVTPWNDLGKLAVAEPPKRRGFRPI